MGTEDVKDRVVDAAYRIDAGAVAEAMLRRPGIRMLLASPLPALIAGGGARTPASASQLRRTD